jgi:hypothetical protein
MRLASFLNPSTDKTDARKCEKVPQLSLLVVNSRAGYFSRDDDLSKLRPGRGPREPLLVRIFLTAGSRGHCLPDISKVSVGLQKGVGCELTKTPCRKKRRLLDKGDKCRTQGT